jgi:nitroimidazol reductase NimA-like FMN-containing flavoprotein (pyridoxamine 5'-phosphate oxidase superfamily)
MGRGLTPEELKAFLAQPYLAMLGTVRQDGGPYVVPV